MNLRNLPVSLLRPRWTIVVFHFAWQRACLNLSWTLVAWLMAAIALSVPAATAQARPASITVALDDDYPPFSFRDSSGQLQGVLKDTWTLWQARTGVQVDLQAMDWAKAQQRMEQGKADVIDTIFETEARRALYAFTAPYARLDVPIFFHESVSGIVNAESLRGFTVGVKEGDACIDVLQSKGVDNVRRYPNYTGVVAGAIAGEVRVFCMDKPPALYLLHQLGAEETFRQSAPLYTGEFHRAVRRDDAAMLGLIEEGFAKITDAEREAIDEKWYGAAIRPNTLVPYARYGGYIVLVVLTLALTLGAWSLSLRRRVAQRTAELSRSVAQLDATLEAVPDLLFELDRDGRYLGYRAAQTDLLAAPPDRLLGRTVREVLPRYAADVVIAALEEASRSGSSHGTQMRLSLPQGERWFEMSVARRRPDGSEVERFVVLSRDISDRKFGEQALQQSEDRFRNFFESGLVGMAICTPDRRWVQFNQRLSDMLGYSEAQLKAISWSAVIDPLDRAVDDANFNRVMVGEIDGYTMEKHFIRKDGSAVPVAVAVRCERNPDGTPKRFFATVEDISERERAQTMLQDNERRLQALLDNISSGVVVHAPDTQVIDANPAACRMLGISLDQLRGKVAIDSYWTFLEEDGTVMPLERYPVHQVITGNKIVTHLVLGVRRPDLREPVWVLVDAYPFRNERGEIGQVVVTFADISDLKRAEQRTRRLNRSLRVLSSCGFGLSDIEDEASYLSKVCEVVAAAGRFALSCVVFANDDAAKIGRVGASAGRAKRYLDDILLSWSEDSPSGQGPFGMAVRTRQIQVNQDWQANEAMAPWRDRAARYGIRSSIALPLVVGDAVIGVLSLYADEVDAFSAEEIPPLEELARNVSSVIETLRMRRQRDRAEDANRAKSEFLANMSHEIRTPLNAIVGLNFLMRRDGVTPVQEERLDKVDTASRHLLSLIDDILDLSKIEAGQVRLESTDFHLSSVLDNVASIIADTARAKGLTVEIDHDAVPFWLKGDPTRLRQALLNYAGNAVKFTERGSIAVRAKLLEERGDDLLVRFSVEDTGTGVSPETASRLFQPFEQGDASVTRRFGGTGLGLAITRRLTDLMGGSCGVEPRLGGGSTFWFTVPLRRSHGNLPHLEAQTEADVEARLKARHAGTKVLVAEDNLINQEVLLALLDSVGLVADVAADGRRAVELATAGEHKLALMDMQMPVMGGLDATRAIRKLPNWTSRPILALTANAFDEDRQACWAAGMDDFIVKPVEVEALYRTLLKWLERDHVDARGTGVPPPAFRG